MTSDKGTRLTDGRIRALSKRLEGVYNAAYRSAVSNNKRSIQKLASLTDEALEGLDEAAKTLKRKAFANRVLRSEGLVNQIAAEIAKAGDTAAAIVRGEMTGIYQLNYDYSTYAVCRQAGVDFSSDFAIYNRNQIAALVQEGQSPFTKIAYRNLGKDRKIVMRLQNQLMLGVLNGESQQKLVRRIRKITGQSAKQAKRVAQTERTRVQSQARHMGIMEAERIGIEMDQQWFARMVNTRDTHAAQNGEIMPAGGKFSNGLLYPGDPNGGASEVINCHCGLKPMVRSASPALRAHREKFGTVTFETYQKRRGGVNP